MESAEGHRGRMESIAAELHDLCQPLTALQCSLDLGLMQGDAEAMRASLQVALLECARLRMAVERMRVVVKEGLEMQGLGARG